MITDTEARRIASEWHSGGGSPLYQFVSTGTITDDVCDEVDDNLIQLRFQYIKDGAEQYLADLAHYLSLHNNRGPQDGWSQLSW